MFGKWIPPISPIDTSIGDIGISIDTSIGDIDLLEIHLLPGFTILLRNGYGTDLNVYVHMYMSVYVHHPTAAGVR